MFDSVELIAEDENVQWDLVTPNAARFDVHRYGHEGPSFTSFMVLYVERCQSVDTHRR